MTEPVGAHKTALKRLAEHLAALQNQADIPISTENDMLTLIVSGALSGEDIARRYLAFYQKLLANIELRQAFLDAVESVEAERAATLTPLPGKPNTQMDLLKPLSSAAHVEQVDITHWRATWQRSLAQLQTIFSPPKLAYRADPVLEDPWFTLLREEIGLANTTYEFSLECTFAEANENALAASINLAVTLSGTLGQPSFPVEAHLLWGDYDEVIVLLQEGRANFPDIPLKAVFDLTANQIKADLNFTLESAA